MVKIKVGAITSIGLIPDSAGPPLAVCARRSSILTAQAIKEQDGNPSAKDEQAALLRAAFFHPVIIGGSDADHR